MSRTGCVFYVVVCPLVKADIERVRLENLERLQTVVDPANSRRCSPVRMLSLHSM